METIANIIVGVLWYIMGSIAFGSMFSDYLERHTKFILDKWYKYLLMFFVGTVLLPISMFIFYCFVYGLGSLIYG